MPFPAVGAYSGRFRFFVAGFFGLSGFAPGWVKCPLFRSQRAAPLPAGAPGVMNAASEFPIHQKYLTSISGRAGVLRPRTMISPLHGNANDKMLDPLATATYCFSATK